MMHGQANIKFARNELRKNRLLWRLTVW